MSPGACKAPALRCAGSTPAVTTGASFPGAAPTYPCSSSGQSTTLRTSRQQVRVLPGVPRRTPSARWAGTPRPGGIPGTEPAPPAGVADAARHRPGRAGAVARSLLPAPGGHPVPGGSRDLARWRSGSAPPCHGGCHRFDPGTGRSRNRTPRWWKWRDTPASEAGAREGMQVRLLLGARNGIWRSLVARSLREGEAAGSNPAIPTELSFMP